MSLVQRNWALRKLEATAQLHPNLQEDGVHWSLLAVLLPHAHPTHEFGSMEMDEVHFPQVVWCGIALFLAGILCSAGGIGGGGVYVPVLMVFGLLSPKDSVPLSKAIVFFGATVTLVMNLRRGGLVSKPFDHEICCLVIPASLIGTLLGVVLNRQTSDFAIVLLLSVLLSGMTVKMFYEAYKSYTEEEGLGASTHLEPGPFVPYDSTTESGAEGGGGGGGGDGGSRAHRGEAAVPSSHDTSKSVKSMEVYVALFMLFIVIVCGVTRYHAGQCLQRMRAEDSLEADAKECHHPATMIWGSSGLRSWMRDDGTAENFLVVMMAFPVAVCLLVVALSSRSLLQDGNWQPSQVLTYVSVGTMTGVLAGLVGIGGGLVFAPFFIVMGVEPAIAVATSSTCVMFTSSSTALQYLLTDRIILSLAIIYGIINVVASFLGTKLVHCLHDNFATRKSYIILIVAAGVSLSACLSFVKLAETDVLS